MDFFYRASKLFWSFASPANLLVIWLVLGGLLLFFARGGRAVRLGRIMTGSGLIFCLLIALVPFGHWGLAWLEERIPRPATLPDNVAGIIVIGGTESENTALARGTLYTNFSTMNRLLVFTMLAGKYPGAQLMYAGGTTRVETTPHLRQADIARDVLHVMMPHREVTYERESRTTFENAVNAARLIGDRRKEPWILVTSAFHMPRALSTFRRQGWNITPMPADYYTEGSFTPLWRADFQRNLTALQTFTREIWGMIGYYYAGNSDQLLPGLQ